MISSKPKPNKSDDLAKQIFCKRHFKQVQHLQFSLIWAMNLYLCSANIQKGCAHHCLSTNGFNPLLTWKQIPRAIIQRKVHSANTMEANLCPEQPIEKEIPCNEIKYSKQCLMLGFPQIPGVKARERTP